MTPPLSAAAPTTIAAMKWDKRVLLVAAPDKRDPLLRDQRRIIARWKSGADERDLAIVEVVGDKVVGDRSSFSARARTAPVRRL